MKSAIMVLIMLPMVCLVVSILLYLSNRSRYNKLISDFQQMYMLPTPYLLHCNMGYLGSPLMLYFFMRLKQNKKIFFLDQKSQAYDFASNSQHSAEINSLKPLYFTFLLGFFCCFLLAVIAVLIKIKII